MMSANSIVSGSASPVSSVDNKVGIFTCVDDVELSFIEARKCNIVSGMTLVLATLNASAVVWRSILIDARSNDDSEKIEEMKSFVVDLVVSAFAMGEGMPFNTAEVAAKRFLERLNGKDYDEVVRNAYHRTRKEFGAPAVVQAVAPPTLKPVETTKPARELPPKLTKDKAQISYDVALLRGVNEAAATVEDLVNHISRDNRHTDEERKALFGLCVELYASLLPTEGEESIVAAKKWFSRIVPAVHKNALQVEEPVQPKAVHTPAEKPKFTTEKLKVSFNIAKPEKRVATLETMLRMILEDARYSDGERETLFLQIRSLYYLTLPESPANLKITERWFEQQLPKAPQRKLAKPGNASAQMRYYEPRVGIRESKAVPVATTPKKPVPRTREDHERLAAAAKEARIAAKEDEARNRRSKDFGETKQRVLTDQERRAAKEAKAAAKKAKKAGKGGR